MLCMFDLISHVHLLELGLDRPLSSNISVVALGSRSFMQSDPIPYVNHPYLFFTFWLRLFLPKPWQSSSSTMLVGQFDVSVLFCVD